MEITLAQLLDAREDRVKKQKQLQEKYKLTLICFTMNIAGPEKTSPIIERAFRIGISCLENSLKHYIIQHKEIEYDICGPVAYNVHIKKSAKRMPILNISADVFDVIRKNFDKVGYSVEFDEIYDEATAIENYISEKRCFNSVEMIAGKLKGYGSYESIPSSVKAEVFGFEVDDSGGDLKLYMQVVKVLGVRMSQEEMFQDYQKMYEETIKRWGDYNMEKEKIWERNKER